MIRCEARRLPGNAASKATEHTKRPTARERCQQGSGAHKAAVCRGTLPARQRSTRNGRLPANARSRRPTAPHGRLPANFASKATEHTKRPTAGERSLPTTDSSRPGNSGQLAPIWHQSGPIWHPSGTNLHQFWHPNWGNLLPRTPSHCLLGVVAWKYGEGEENDDDGRR